MFLISNKDFYMLTQLYSTTWNKNLLLYNHLPFSKNLIFKCGNYKLDLHKFHFGNIKSIQEVSLNTSDTIEKLINSSLKC